MPSRRAFADKYLEGEGGLFPETVDAMYDSFYLDGQAWGSWIIFDAARDINGHSLEVMMLQNKTYAFLYWTALPHANSKTHEWTKNQVKAALEGKVDYDAMEALEEVEVPDEEEEESPKVPKLDPSRASMAKLLSLGDLVWAAGADNCSVATLSLCALGDDTGIVPFGDCSHAFSRNYLHVWDTPKLKPLLGHVNDICSLFLNYTKPRALLLGKCGKTVRRIVPTRFVSGAGTVERLIFLHEHLHFVVSSDEFNTWVANQDTDVKALAKSVKNVVSGTTDPLFWAKLGVMDKLSVAWVVAVRLFDGAKPGSACMQYKIWSMMGATVQKVFKEDVTAELASFFDDALLRRILRIIEKDWEKFHYPVFSAAFVGNIYFRKELVSMVDSEFDNYMALVEETVDVICEILRRFNRDGSLRKVPLSRDCDELLSLREEVMREVEEYVAGEGVFLGVDFSRVTVSPATWWRLRCKDCLIKRFMTWICTLSPSSTPVERQHKLFKATRVKFRSLLGYLRAFALNFIASRYGTEDGSADLDWISLSHYKAYFDKLSTVDVDFLDAIVEKADNAKKVADDIEREGLDLDVPHVDVLEPSLPDDTVIRTAESDAAEAEVEVPRVLVSSRGRVIRRKIIPSM